MKLHTTFFGPISWYSDLIREGGTACIDSCDRYQKQTSRSRCRIATANGVQTLSVPVTLPPHNPDGSLNRNIRDVRISDHGDWRRVHWNALLSAYGESPFFDYYADDLRPFFEKRWDFLYDYNMEITEKVLELIGITDAVVAKLPKNKPEMQPYYQVFKARHGFIPDLSILDLLFNEGNEAVLFL